MLDSELEALQVDFITDELEDDDELDWFLDDDEVKVGITTLETIEVMVQIHLLLMEVVDEVVQTQEALGAELEDDEDDDELELLY